MKITHNKVGQNLNATDTQTEKASGASKSGDVKKNSNSTAASGSNSTSEATKVQLSPRVQDIKKIKELAQNAPDVDVDKVAKFKQMIAEGKYKVDAKGVADRMVDEHLKSRATEE